MIKLTFNKKTRPEIKSILCPSCLGAGVLCKPCKGTGKVIGGKL